MVQAETYGSRVASPGIEADTHRAEIDAHGAGHAWERARKVLLTWALCMMLPIVGLGGFTVGTDASGYFKLNDFGSYGGDELLIKASLMQHRPHNALLLGDSRAAYTKPPEMDDLKFFNAAAGGASPGDMMTLLRQHDLEGVRLVVWMMYAGDFLASCQPETSRLSEPMNPVRYALTWDAVQNSVDHIERRLLQAVPDHQPDGTRFAGKRMMEVPGREGERSAEYLKQVRAAGDDHPFEESFEDSEPCARTIEEARRYVEERGAEFMMVLPPVNQDILDATGSDSRQVRRILEEKIEPYRSFIFDFTASRYSDASSFPPRDELHFRPEIGGEVLSEAIAEFCGQEERCKWRDR